MTIHHVYSLRVLEGSLSPAVDESVFSLSRSSTFNQPPPYTHLHICQLLNPCMADQPITGPLLQEVRKLCRLSNIPQEIGELKEHLDLLSLFGDRNPLVSSV